MKTVQVLLVTLALGLAGPVLADKGDKGKAGKNGHAAETSGKGAKHGPPTFSSGERGEIEKFYAANPNAGLPPGLAKKGKVPPGWAKKLERGKPVPPDLWEVRVPLPRDILVKLPPPPPGVVLVRIHDHIVKVREHTHEILDKIGLPHP